MNCNKTPYTSNILLAPLAGYTDYPFRKMCSKHGAGMVYTELISAEGICRNNKKTIDLLAIFQDEMPVGIQIFGSKPERIAEAAQIVEKLPVKPLLIDINSGCCARKVCSNSSGAALLKDPEIFYEVCHQTVAAVETPVTVKIRTGFSETTKNYMEIVDAAERAGVVALTIHGRTSEQQYTGKADWKIIEEVAAHSGLPVFGNGDILSYKEAQEKIETTSCTGVMIGRGALGNPWIFSGKEPTLEERIATANEHVASMVAYYGEYGVTLARKHLVKYFHGIPRASKVRHKLVTSNSQVEIQEVLATLLPRR